ncbi:MAG: imidazole glycerol phosphate synthase subunit HisH [Anaerolineae bacterium]|nr:MAG: imidazole glycerol phosphate synthase subunit HisH [Anaerolineae bacterium]MCL4880258.1 imidazole glycerol phosphate synthase subunit HisH [Anaerolineae bacterium]
MIGVIDYGASNIRSVANALKHLGADMKLATRPAEIARAEKLILPGVGAFRPGMERLQQQGFVEFLLDSANKSVPILGICLGMQFLLESSEEDGFFEGLGLIPGKCVRFQIEGKVPHMGWNQLEHDGSNPIMRGIPTVNSYAYFVHSFHATAIPDSCVIATTEYGYPYPSIIGRENIFGAQFHPEKSQQVGLRLLKNFCDL